MIPAAIALLAPLGGMPGDVLCQSWPTGSIEVGGAAIMRVVEMPPGTEEALFRISTDPSPTPRPPSRVREQRLARLDVLAVPKALSLNGAALAPGDRLDPSALDIVYCEDEMLQTGVGILLSDGVVTVLAPLQGTTDPRLAALD